MAFVIDKAEASVKEQALRAYRKRRIYHEDLD
jgi:hypothetical protein